MESSCCLGSWIGYLQDNNWHCFNTYLSFENLKREPNGSIDEYLSTFEIRLHKCREMEIEFPDAILACRFSKSCNLSELHPSDAPSQAGINGKDVQLTPFSGRRKLQTLANESASCAVLDTGCPTTVCGVDWLTDYLKELSNYCYSSLEVV